MILKFRRMENPLNFLCAIENLYELVVLQIPTCHSLHFCVPYLTFEDQWLFVVWIPRYFNVDSSVIWENLQKLVKKWVVNNKIYSRVKNADGILAKRLKGANHFWDPKYR